MTQRDSEPFLVTVQARTEVTTDIQEFFSFYLHCFVGIPSSEANTKSFSVSDVPSSWLIHLSSYMVTKFI